MINRIIICLTTFILLSGQVMAISAQDAQSLNNDSLYYLPGAQPTAGACGVTGSTTSDSADSAQTTMPSDFTVANGKEIAQMLVIGVTDEATAVSMEKTYQIGGFLFNTDFPFSAANTAAIASAGEVAPLFATDEEGGNVDRIAGDYPSAKTMGTEADAQVTAEGKTMGQAMTADGLTVDFAPVADIDNGKNFISQEGRSFGSTPAVVADKAGAFAQGLESAGITPTFKHFPGDGNTVSNTNNAANLGNTDTGPATTPSLASLEANDLVPYQTLLQGYTGAVMVGNQIVPDLTDGAPASLSSATYTLLRGKYAFNGVAFTDSLQDWMGNIDTTVVEAIEAGADMPLINNPTAAEVKGVIGAIQTAVTNGKISQSQIDSSVNKILAFKAGAASSANANGGAAACCGANDDANVTPNLSPSAAAQQVWTYLISQGLTPTQAAAILGNLQEESSVDPQKVQGGGESPTDPLDGSTGWGIAQWTSLNRQQNLQDYATSQGQPVDSLTLQEAFVIYEGTADGTLANLKTIQGTNLKAAVDYWMTNYESPQVATEHEDTRLSDAEGDLVLYGSGGGAPGAVQTPAPTPAPAPTTPAPIISTPCAGATTGATGTVDQGTVAQLAQKILNYKSTGQYNCDNAGDCTDLENMVNGVALSSEPGTDCVATALDPRVLQLILYLIEVGNFQIGTFAMCGDHHFDSDGGHSGGFAVDISSVNGVAVATNSAQAKANTLAVDQFLDNNLPASIKLDQQINYGYGNQEDDTLAATQQVNGAVCTSIAACVSYYTLAVEEEHENHIHAGFLAPAAGQAN